MNERIKQVRLSAKLSQTEFAEKILVSRSAVCKMESGENSPSEQTVKLICQEFNVNGDWLRTVSVGIIRWQKSITRSRFCLSMVSTSTNRQTDRASISV